MSKEDLPNNFQGTNVNGNYKSTPNNSKLNWNPCQVVQLLARAIAGHWPARKGTG